MVETAGTLSTLELPTLELHHQQQQREILGGKVQHRHSLWKGLVTFCKLVTLFQQFCKVYICGWLKIPPGVPSSIQEYMAKKVVDKHTQENYVKNKTQYQVNMYLHFLAQNKTQLIHNVLRKNKLIFTKMEKTLKYLHYGFLLIQFHSSFPRMYIFCFIRNKCARLNNGKILCEDLLLILHSTYTFDGFLHICYLHCCCSHVGPRF